MTVAELHSLWCEGAGGTNTKVDTVIYKHLCKLAIPSMSYTDIVEWALHTKGEERDTFIAAYLESGPHAASNIGYISGYYDGHTGAKIQKLFRTEHPVFGSMRW